LVAFVEIFSLPLIGADHAMMGQRNASPQQFTSILHCRGHVMATWFVLPKNAL
jgi:hypothetical protein